MKKALLIGVSTFALPLIAFAQVTDFQSLGTLVVTIINTILVPVLFAVAFIVFIWGAFLTFIWGANSEEVSQRGKNLMLWGLIGFFVMVSVWGLVNILTNSIQTDSTLPTLPGAGQLP